MPVTQVNTPNGKVIDVDHPEGALENDILSYAVQQYSLDPSVAYEPTSVLGAIAEPFQRFGAGFVSGTVLSPLEGLTQLADAGLNLVGLEDVIDEEDEDYIINLARQGRQNVNEFLGVDSAYDDNFAAKFGEGFGSFASFLTPGALVKGLGLTGKAASAVGAGGAGTLAVSSGAAQQSQRIEQARAQGIDVDPETEDAAIGFGGLIGLSELAPIGVLLKGLPVEVLRQPFGKTIVERVGSALRTGTAEGLQELGAGLLQDATELNLYNPDLQIGESAWDDLTIGGSVGAAADLILNYAAGRRARTLHEASFAEEQDISEFEEAEAQLREEKEAREQERRQARSAQAEPVVEEDIDVINVEPATTPYTAADRDGIPTVREKVAGGNPFRAMAIEISRRLGDKFPVYEQFEIQQTGAETTIVTDSDGKQYGPEHADPRDAIQLAGALNERVLSENVERNNQLVVDEFIEESGQPLDAPQRRTLLSMARKVFSPKRNTYHQSAVNYAADTTTEQGFAETLTAEQAIEQGIPRKQMTAAQKINSSRLERGLPETTRFSLSEVRKVIGDNAGKLAEFESGASGADTFRAVSIDGVPSISIDREGRSTGTVTDRPVSAVERQGLKEQGKRAPKRTKFTSMRDAQEYASYLNRRKGGAFLPSSELFGEPELSQVEFTDLLAEKNIDADYNSPEVKKLAEKFTGRKLRRDQTLDDLSGNDKRLFYYKLRNLPRFDKPTKIPVFEVKPYSSAQLQVALNTLRESNRDILPLELEGRGMPIRAPAYNKLVEKARQIAKPEQIQPEIEAEGAAVLALPAPDQRKQAAATAVEKRLKKLGLSNDFTFRMVDAVRNVARDANGNIILGDMQEGAEGGYGTNSKVLQISFDSIIEQIGPEATDAEVEAAAIDILNHEIVHALRNLDLITQSELQLLERLSRKYIRSDGETFGQWAERTYSDLTPVKRAEEAVAELIRYAFRGTPIVDAGGKSIRLSGKPRSIAQRIARFFKSLLGYTRDFTADSRLLRFSEFMEALETGQVGARERGEIRTLYELERQAEVLPARFAGYDKSVTLTGAPAQKAAQAKQKIKDFDESLLGEEVDDEILASRIDRAEQQGFDTNTIYFHGTASPDIKKFRASIPAIQGIVAGHFTVDPAFASKFAPVVAREREAPAVYPVFLRVKNTFNPFDSDMVERVGREIEKGTSGAGYQDILEQETRKAMASPLMSQAMETAGITDVSPLANDKLVAAQDAIKKISSGKPDFVHLERVAAFAKAAGFDSYFDVEDLTGQGEVTGIAIFDPANIKGVFAEYDPTAVPKGMEYADDIMFSRRSDAGGLSARDMFSGTDPDMFDRETGEVDYRLRNKSRKVVVDMPIDMFLHLAASMEGARADSEALVRELAESGKKFDRIPLLALSFESGKPEHRYVYDHDGRHRARQLKSMGYDTVPVMVMDASIRWDQQGEGSYDRVKTWPRSILNQDGNFVFPMFLDRNANVRYGRFSPQSKDDIMFSRRLQGMPESFDVDGQAVEFGYHQPAVDAARRYSEKSGIAYEPLTEYAPVDQKMARKIAIEYDLMEDMPNDPTVRAAYDAMIEETLAQYEEILNSGLTVQFIKGADPYGNPRNAILDVINNNHMYVFSTRDGYGMDELTPEVLARNPMLRETPYQTADGDPMLANDVFRVVHDYFGHIKNGVGFRARGEENAWQSHAAMYSPLARRAMTSETRGQNSWVNFGPNAAFNATANGADTVYADQKTGLLPLWVSEEARQSDPRRRDPSVFQEGLEGAIDADGKLQLSHFSRERIARTDPKMAGRGADRTRRYAPEGTYFGIVKADENGYRRETILGDVEITFSVDPLLVYPLNADPYGLLARNPAGNLDWDATLSALNNAGFIGFRVNDKRLGKVAFINQPLISDESVAEVRQKPVTKNIETEVIEPRQTISPAQAEKVAEDNLKTIQDNPTQVPRFSVKASPEAQYIAQHPNAAQEPDSEQMYSRKQYEPTTPGAKSAIDKLTKNARPETPINTYNNVLDTGPIKDFFTRLKTAFINKNARLEKYYQKVPELRELEADSSAIAAALFADRAKGILASAIKDGVPVYRDGVTKVEDFVHNGRRYRGLIEVMSLLYTKDHGDLSQLAQTYAMVQRGKWLDKKGKLSPVDAATRQAIEAEVDSLTDSSGRNPVKEWYDVWQAYNNKTIDFLRATGILNDETAEQWKDSAYIPFYREAEGDETTPRVAKGPFSNLRSLSEFKRYRGSEKGVDVGLIESISLNLSAAIEMGMKNVAQQRIARDMLSMGLAQRLQTGKTPDNPTMSFKFKGDTVTVELFDSMLADSMMSIGADANMSLTQRVLGWPANKLRELITRDPGFMVANLMRDTLSAWVTSGADIVPVVDSLKGLVSSTEALERAGVVGGYDYSNDPKDIQEFFDKELKRRNKQLSALNLLGRAWDALGNATTRSDAATRMAVYKDVLARTGNEAEALFQAMEVINFSRRGASPLFRVITTAIPFLNARMQGLDVFYRAATGGYSANKALSRNRAIASMLMRGATLTGLTGLYYMLVSDDDQYKEQSEEIKDNNWIIPTSWGAPVRLPIPFEVGVIFKTIPETVLASTVGDKSRPEVTDTVRRAIVSTFEINPLGIQAFAPIAEAALNYNSFTGREIVPYYMDQNVTAGLQDRLGSTELGKVIGQAFNVSPLKVDHVLYGYTGTIGSYVLDAVDAIARTEAVKGDEASKMPSWRVPFDYPIAKRFFAQTEGSGLRQDAYDLYKEVLTVTTTVNKLKKEGRVEELERYLATRQHLLALKKPVYNIKSQLDNARKQKALILQRDIDGDLKRQMIEDIDAQINEYLKVIPLLKEAADLPFIETTF